jgi:hypothetical protein
MKKRAFIPLVEGRGFVESGKRERDTILSREV